MRCYAMEGINRKNVQIFTPTVIREIIKGLSPNQAIYSTFSGEIHHLSVQSDSKQQYFSRIVGILTTTTQGLIKGLSTNQAIYNAFLK